MGGREGWAGPAERERGWKQRDRERATGRRSPDQHEARVAVAVHHSREDAGRHHKYVAAHDHQGGRFVRAADVAELVQHERRGRHPIDVPCKRHLGPHHLDLAHPGALRDCAKTGVRWLTRNPQNHVGGSGGAPLAPSGGWGATVAAYSKRTTRWSRRRTCRRKRACSRRRASSTE